MKILNFLFVSPCPLTSMFIFFGLVWHGEYFSTSKQIVVTYVSVVINDRSFFLFHKNKGVLKALNLPCVTLASFYVGLQHRYYEFVSPGCDMPHNMSCIIHSAKIFKISDNVPPEPCELDRRSTISPFPPIHKVTTHLPSISITINSLFFSSLIIKISALSCTLLLNCNDG